MTYPLIEQLAEYGLYCLIPEEPDAEYKDSFETQFERLQDYDGSFYDLYSYSDEDPESESLDGFHEEDKDYTGTQFGSKDCNRLEVSDLQALFEDYSYMDPDQFLQLNLWEILGITKKQMDLVPWANIPDYMFTDFYSSFISDGRNISLDKKLLYAAAQAHSDYRNLIPERNDVSDYCERIIDRHSFDESMRLIQIFEDYIQFYDDAVEMNDRRKEIGEHVFDYSMFPKPSHLKDLHDKAFRDHIAMETERMSENQERLSLKIKGVSETSDYKQYLYRSNGFVVLPVTSQMDLIEEGQQLQHCVATYGSYMASGSSYIYRIREEKNINNALYTAEITPEDIVLHQKAKLKQCYGYNDTVSKTDSLRNFIIEWATKTGFRITCMI